MTSKKPAASDRPRFDGPPSDITAAIAPWVKSPQFLPATSGSLARPLRANIEIFKALAKLHPSLSFKQRDMEVAIDALWQTDWNLGDDNKRKWGETLAHRVRALCRFASQGRYRKPTPVWVGEIWLSPSAGSASSVAPPLDWLFGWDAELRNCWRSRGVSGAREYAVSVKPEDGAAEYESPIAAWSDGTHYVVCDIANEDIAMTSRVASRVAAPRPRKAKVKPAANYTIVGEAEQGRVTISVIPDRKELCIIKVGGRQKCQVHTGIFSEKGGVKPRDIAMDFMKRLSQELIDGVTQIDDLKSRRDAMLAEMGINLRKRVPLKAPDAQVFSDANIPQIIM